MKKIRINFQTQKINTKVKVIKLCKYLTSNIRCVNSSFERNAGFQSSCISWTLERTARSTIEWMDYYLLMCKNKNTILYIKC